MAFTPATTLEMVEALYIGYFGRAGEPGGVSYWVNQINSAVNPQTGFAQAAAAFAVQQEAKDQHPFLANPGLVAPADFIESLYTQLLGRQSDASGKAYWVAQATAAQGNPFALGLLVAQFISGAQGDDIIVLQNKIDAAEYFTGKLASAGITGTDSKGQVLPNIDAEATKVISSITKDVATVDAAKAETDAFVTKTVTTGQTFTLTEGADIIPGLIGSAGTSDVSKDDIIIAGNSVVGPVGDNNLGSGDVIDAGGGFDVLRVISDNGNPLTPNLSNVERINVQALAGTNINLINANGVQQIWSVDATANVTLTEINDDVVLGFDNTKGGITATFDEGAIKDGNVDVAIIGSGEKASTLGFTDLNPQNASFLNVTAADSTIGAINVKATGDASRLTINVTADDPIKNLNISGDADLFLSAGINGDEIETVVSTSTGDIDLLLPFSDEDLSVTMGSGNDRLTIGSANFDSDDKYDGGAGDDALNLLYTAGPITLTSTTVAAQGKTTILAANALTSVETLIVDAWTVGGPITVDASKFTKINNFTFDDTNNGNNFQQDTLVSVTVTGVDGDNKFAINTAAGSASFDGADELNLKVMGDLGSLTATGFDTANVEIAVNEDVPGNDDDINLGTLTLSDETKVVITGEADTVIVTGVAFDALAGTGAKITLDASAFKGDAFLTGGGGVDTLIGGEGDDVLDGSSLFVPAAMGVSTVNLNNLNNLGGFPLVSVSVQVDVNDDGIFQAGETFTGVGGTANSAALALAGDLQDAGVDAEADGGVVTITSNTSDALTLGAVEATVNPGPSAGVPVAGTHTPGVTAVPADATVQTLTFAQGAGQYGIGQVITYNFNDGDGDAGDTKNVSYVVQAADVATADPAQIAANVAAGFLAAFETQTGVVDSATIVRNGSVLTITSNNTGGTADNSNIVGTETVDTGNSVTSAITNQGSDAIVGVAEVYTFNGAALTNTSGVTQVYTITVDGVSASITLAPGEQVTGIQVANALQIADGAGGVFDDAEALNNNVIGFNSDNATPPVITATVDNESEVRAQDENGPDNNDPADDITTETDGVAQTVFSSDKYTGNAGEDVFIVQTANIEGLTAVQAAAAADVITDFTIADDTIDFAGIVAATATNYAEGPIQGFGNFNGARAQAEQDFNNGGGNIIYSAQQVGADVFIFADSDGNNLADQVVQLLGVTLADLTNTGAYIV